MGPVAHTCRQRDQPGVRVRRGVAALDQVEVPEPGAGPGDASDRHVDPAAASRRLQPRVGFGEVDAAAALTAAGRLAAGSAQPAGLAATAYFGGGPGGPIAVIQRDNGLISTLAAVAAVAAVAFVVLFVFLIVVLRRRRRQPLPPASPPPAVPPKRDHPHRRPDRLA